jgi:hypothetical protein
MKTLLLLLLSIPAFSQVKVQIKKALVTIDYTIPQGKVFNLDDEGTLTTNTAIYKKETYPVYVTKKGKLFIKLVNPKTQKEYRKYIKE